MEQTLEREQNERDVLESLGEYKRDIGTSVEWAGGCGEEFGKKEDFSILLQDSTSLEVSVMERIVRSKKSNAGPCSCTYQKHFTHTSSLASLKTVFYEIQPSIYRWYTGAFTVVHRHWWCVP